MKEINVYDYKGNPFEVIGKDWLLIAAESDGRVNAMTASWGGLGVIWNKPVAYIFIRESRFTKTLVDCADRFSLTVFDHAKYAKELAYFGSASGKNEDKIKNGGLTVANDEKAPYFSEGKTVFICKKLSKTFISPEGFIEGSIDEKFYATKDYHEMYIGEIEKILEK